MKENPCPICNRICESIPYPARNALTIECIVCGKFDITRTAVEVLKGRNLDVLNQVAFSHWLFVNSVGKENPVFITGEILIKILPNLKLPSLDEQFTNLIQYLGDNAKTPDKPVSIFKDRFSSTVGSVAGEGANYIINYLEKQGLIQKGTSNATITSLILTPEGWERYGQITRGYIKTNKVFMAMKYDDSVLIGAYKFFQDAVKNTGFKLNILDEVLKAGLIDDQLRVNIRQAKFILADLTYSNAGEYWEAGYAEGLGKQVIYLCEKSHWEANKTHFDINHHTTVVWSLSTIEEDIRKLKATIRATFPAEAIMEDI